MTRDKQALHRGCARCGKDHSKEGGTVAPFSAHEQCSLTGEGNAYISIFKAPLRKLKILPLLFVFYYLKCLKQMTDIRTGAHCLNSISQPEEFLLSSRKECSNSSIKLPEEWYKYFPAYKIFFFISYSFFPKIKKLFFLKK